MNIDENENKTSIEINSKNKDVIYNTIKKENIIENIDKNKNNDNNINNINNDIKDNENKKESDIKDINNTNNEVQNESNLNEDNTNNTTNEILDNSKINGNHSLSNEIKNNTQTENTNNILTKTLNNLSKENKNKEQVEILNNSLIESKSNVSNDNKNNLQAVKTDSIQITNINEKKSNDTKKEEKRILKKSHVHLKRSTISAMQPLIIRKGASSNYLKGNVSYLNEGNDVLLDPEKNYSDVIVIHPGSRYLRIGRASDAFPKEIPNCIARDVTPLKINIQNKEQKISEKKENIIDNNISINDNDNNNNNNNNNNNITNVASTVSTTTNINNDNDNNKVIEENNDNDKEIDNSTEEHSNKRRKGNDLSKINTDTDSDSNNSISQKRNLRNKNKYRSNEDSDENGYMFSDELIINKEYLKKLETDIKFRMRLAKMRVTPNAHSQVQQYNIQSIPEIIPDHNDPYKIEWTSTDNKDKYFVGLKALRLKSYIKKDETITDNTKPHYRIFYPIKYGTFNLEDYDNLRVVLADIERIWDYAIINELGIKRSELKNYNVVLVIPDVYDKIYVIELINLLLKEMNFKAIIVQQESACAAFGAGFSMSCIVDIGAQKTSISCIEDGFCIPETRMNLKYGGDDITKLFMALLVHNSFPYSEIDLTRTYDWQLAQELKERFCTVIESDLTCRVYTFYVRVPDKDTRVFSLKVYDEVVMAPMLLFNTHMIDFKNKFHYLIDSKKNYMNEVSVEEIVRFDDHIKSQNQTHTNNNAQTNNIDIETNSECPTPNTASTVNLKEEVKSEFTNNHKLGKFNSMDIDVESIDDNKSHEDNNDNKNLITINDSQENDVFEKISQPLDVAIAQSISTYVTTISEGWEFTGSNSRKEKDIEDRIRKIYSSILVIGGGGMIPGLNKMIEDRVSHWLHVLLPQGILNSAIQHEIKNETNTSEDKKKPMNKKANSKGPSTRKGPNGGNNITGNGTAIISPTVITSPRDMDSRVLTWKGASILSKLDCASEMWVGAKEWENGGIKGCYKWLFLWE